MRHQNLIYGSKTLDHGRDDRVLRVVSNQTGLGCKIGRQTPAPGRAIEGSENLSLSAKQKALILDSLAKVEGKSFVVFCIKLFLNDVQTKTDREIKEMVLGLRDQSNDNREMLKRILGDQYELLMTVNFS